MALVQYQLTGYFVNGIVQTNASSILLWPRVEQGDGVPTELTRRNWLIACTASDVHTILVQQGVPSSVLVSPADGRAGIAINVTADGHERFVIYGTQVYRELVGANGLVTTLASAPVAPDVADLYQMKITGGALLVNGQQIFTGIIITGARWGIYLLPTKDTRIGPIMSDINVETGTYNGQVDIIGVPESPSKSFLVTSNWPALFVNTNLPLSCLAQSQDGGAELVSDSGKKAFYSDSRLGIYWLYPADMAPNPPASISGTATGTTQIRWQWQDLSSFETGFNLYDDANTLIVQLPPNTTNYVEAGLTPGISYTRKISAYNSWGESASVTATVATATGSPGVPTWAIALRRGADVFVNWGDVPNASYVDIMAASTGTVLAHVVALDGVGVVTTTETSLRIRATSGTAVGAVTVIPVSVITAQINDQPVPMGYPASHASVLWTWGVAPEGVNGIRFYDATHRPLATIAAGLGEYLEEGLLPDVTIVRYARYVQGSSISNPSSPVAVLMPPQSGAVTPGTPESLPALKRFVSGIGDGDDGKLVQVTPHPAKMLSAFIMHQGVHQQSVQVPKEISFQFRYHAEVGDPANPLTDFGALMIDRRVATTYAIDVSASATQGPDTYTYAKTFNGTASVLNGVIVMTQDYTLLQNSSSAPFPGPASAVTWNFTLTSYSPAGSNPIVIWKGANLIIIPGTDSNTTVNIALSGNQPQVIDPASYLSGGIGYGMHWVSQSGTLTAYFTNNSSASTSTGTFDELGDISGTGTISVSLLRGFPAPVDGEWFNGVVNKDNKTDPFRAMLYMPTVNPATYAIYSVQVSDAAVTTAWNLSSQATTDHVDDYCTFASTVTEAKVVSTIWTGSPYPVSAVAGARYVTIDLPSVDPTYPGTLNGLTVVAVADSVTNATVIGVEQQSTNTNVFIDLQPLHDGHQNWQMDVQPGRIYYHQNAGVLASDLKVSTEAIPGPWLAGTDSAGSLAILPGAEIYEEAAPGDLVLRYDQPDPATLTVFVRVFGRWVSAPWSLEGRKLRLHTQMPYDRMAVHYHVLHSAYIDNNQIKTHGTTGVVNIWSGNENVVLPIDLHPLRAPRGGYLVLEKDAPVAALITILMPGGMVRDRTYVSWVQVVDAVGNAVANQTVSLTATNGTLSGAQVTTGPDGMASFLLTPTSTPVTASATLGAIVGLATAPVYSLLSVARMQATPAQRATTVNTAVAIAIGWIAPRPPEASFTSLSFSVTGGLVASSASGPWVTALSIPPRPDGSGQVFVKSATPGTIVLSVQAGEAMGGALVVVK